MDALFSDVKMMAIIMLICTLAGVLMTMKYLNVGGTKVESDSNSFPFILLLLAVFLVFAWQIGKFSSPYEQPPRDITSIPPPPELTIPPFEGESKSSNTSPMPDQTYTEIFTEDESEPIVIETSEAGLHYIQCGVFSIFEYAQNFKFKLEEALGMDCEIFMNEQYQYRVCLGKFESSDAAKYFYDDNVDFFWENDVENRIIGEYLPEAIAAIMEYPKG